MASRMSFAPHPRAALTNRSVPYAALVATFEKIEATSKRLEILSILTQFLLVVAQRDTATTAKDSNLLRVVYLCINRVCDESRWPRSTVLTRSAVSGLYGD